MVVKAEGVIYGLPLPCYDFGVQTWAPRGMFPNRISLKKRIRNTESSREDFF